jgi:hypothetical protein
MTLTILMRFPRSSQSSLIQWMLTRADDRFYSMLTLQHADSRPSSTRETLFPGRVRPPAESAYNRSLKLEGSPRAGESSETGDCHPRQTGINPLER